VHEIHNFDYLPREDSEFYEKLFEFGYGLPDCKVFNYWDEPHPVSLAGADARTLAMCRDGAAIVVVTDYGEGGACETTLDAAALGLKPEAEAIDFETGAEIEKAGPGCFRFELKKHDFKVIKVQ